MWPTNPKIVCGFADPDLDPSSVHIRANRKLAKKNVEMVFNFILVCFTLCFVNFFHIDKYLCTFPIKYYMVFLYRHGHITVAYCCHFSHHT